MGLGELKKTFGLEFFSSNRMALFQHSCKLHFGLFWISRFCWQAAIHPPLIPLSHNTWPLQSAVRKPKTCAIIEPCQKVLQLETCDLKRVRSPQVDLTDCRGAKCLWPNPPKLSTRSIARERTALTGWSLLAILRLVFHGRLDSPFRLGLPGRLLMLLHLVLVVVLLSIPAMQIGKKIETDWAFWIRSTYYASIEKIAGTHWNYMVLGMAWFLKAEYSPSKAVDQPDLVLNRQGFAAPRSMGISGLKIGHIFPKFQTKVVVDRPLRKAREGGVFHFLLGHIHKPQVGAWDW